MNSLQFLIFALIPLLVCLHPSIRSDQSEHLNCIIFQPSELDIIYDHELEIQVGVETVFTKTSSQVHSSRPYQISVELDGTLVGKASCPSRFMLKGLVAGVHSLSVSRSKDTPGHNQANHSRTFFVAHKVFHHGGKWSPDWPNRIATEAVCSQGQMSDQRLFPCPVLS
jgi:hypothetical protein